MRLVHALAAFAVYSRKWTIPATRLIVVASGLLSAVAAEDSINDGKRLGALEADSGASRLSLSTAFDGGSAEVRECDPTTGTVHIQPAWRGGRGWPCWWYVRLDGLATGQTVTLKVSGNPQPFRGNARLAPAWAQPDHAAISLDNTLWSQIPRTAMSAEQVAIYQFEAPAERVWLAWGPPFLPEHANDLLARVTQQVPDAERFVLAHTREGRAVNGVRLGAKDTQSAALGVWVHARQHAWESGSSWVGKGLIEWVASDDPLAMELRRKSMIYFVPIMDVDNVSLGAGGKESMPRDHNRDWADEPVYPEVAAAQRRIRELNAQGRLHVFLDLHNPAPGDRRPYFYGPLDLDRMGPLQQRNYMHWLTLAAEYIRDPLPVDPKYRFATYVTTDEERRRVSGNWVRNNASEHVVSVCLETAWNTPHSTQEGYQAVGRQLGQTLARYLANDPRRP